jgi:septum formation protein
MLVLCSGSPRRRELLAQLGLRFDICVPEIDEALRPGERPGAYVERLAREKAAAGLARYGRPGTPLGADTIVVLAGEVLGKPRDRADARRMLSLLSGSTHEVMTSVRVGELQQTVVTEVRFRPIGEDALGWLVDSGDGDDKAGAYAVQGLAGAFVERLDGSLTNVVGLPLAETLQLLERAGVRPPWSGAASAASGQR